MPIHEQFPNLTDEQLMAMEGEVFEDVEPSVIELEDGSFEVDLSGEPLDEMFEEELAIADHGANLAEILLEAELEEISGELLDKVDQDITDRKEWASILADAIKLLGLQIDPAEDLPFEGAATATHPMLLEAITKFQAKAFSELFPAKGPVKTQIMGMITPDRQMQASRVGDFMNFQVEPEMTEYGPELDRLLFYFASEGSA
jgi:hypothetical protein